MCVCVRGHLAIYEAGVKVRDKVCKVFGTWEVVTDFADIENSPLYLKAHSFHFKPWVSNISRNK